MKITIAMNYFTLVNNYNSITSLGIGTLFHKLVRKCLGHSLVCPNLETQYPMLTSWAKKNASLTQKEKIKL